MAEKLTSMEDGKLLVPYAFQLPYHPHQGLEHSEPAPVFCHCQDLGGLSEVPCRYMDHHPFLPSPTRKQLLGNVSSSLVLALSLLVG